MMKRFNYNYIYFSLIAIGLLLWVLLKKGILAPYYLQIFILICINIILTTSLNLINGFCGQLSIGHAGFMAIGAYSSCLLTTIIFGSKDGMLIYISALFIGGILSSFTAYIIGIAILGLRGDYLAIVTLAFGEVVRFSIKLTDAIGRFLEDIGLGIIGELIILLGGPKGLAGIPRSTNLFYAVSITILTIFIIDRLVHSSYGRAWVSIREDEISAEMMGINTTRYKLLAFTISAFFAGIAGGLYAHLLMFIHPDSFSFIKSVECLVFLYLGGMGSILGSILSSSTLTFLSEFLRIIQFQEYRLVIYPLILIILMLTKSEGFFKKDL